MTSRYCRFFETLKTLRTSSFFEHIDQCFSTCVPWHIFVPQNDFRFAAKWLNYDKQCYFHYLKNIVVPLNVFITKLVFRELQEVEKHWHRSSVQFNNLIWKSVVNIRNPIKLHQSSQPAQRFPTFIFSRNPKKEENKLAYP